jgi:hypothetical protein
MGGFLGYNTRKLYGLIPSFRGNLLIPTSMLESVGSEIGLSIGKMQERLSCKSSRGVGGGNQSFLYSPPPYLTIGSEMVPFLTTSPWVP